MLYFMFSILLLLPRICNGYKTVLRVLGSLDSCIPSLILVYSILFFLSSLYIQLKINNLVILLFGFSRDPWYLGMCYSKVGWVSILVLLWSILMLQSYTASFIRQIDMESFYFLFL